MFTIENLLSNKYTSSQSITKASHTGRDRRDDSIKPAQDPIGKTFASHSSNEASILAEKGKPEALYLRLTPSPTTSSVESETAGKTTLTQSKVTVASSRKRQCHDEGEGYNDCDSERDSDSEEEGMMSVLSAILVA